LARLKIKVIKHQKPLGNNSIKKLQIDSDKIFRETKSGPNTIN